MRDEDLNNLPQSIERWRFAEMLEALGFGEGAQNNLFGFWVDREGVHARVYATGEDGRKYRAAVDPDDPMSVPEPASHEISIPLVGDWDRPRCGFPANPGASSSPRCTRKPDHLGLHSWAGGLDSDEGTFIGTRCEVVGPDGLRCSLGKAHRELHAASEGGFLHKW